MKHSYRVPELTVYGDIEKLTGDKYGCGDLIAGKRLAFAIDSRGFPGFKDCDQGGGGQIS